ncbi:MAG: DUF4397 domain-containing protein [Cyclobacteriaceae bacterium]
MTPKISIVSIKNAWNWPSFLMLLMVPFTISCLDMDGEGIENPPTAYVSFYNGTGAENGIRIEVDEKYYDRRPFEFGHYIDYWYFFTGERNFSFTIPGTGGQVLDTAVTLKVDKAYSFFMADNEGELQTLFVEDSLALPESGKASMRLVHLSSDAPVVNLFKRDTEEPLIDTQAFKDITDYTSLEIGQTDLILKSTDGDTELARLNDVQIREGRIYTLILRGKIGAADNSEEALRLQLIRNYPNY